MHARRKQLARGRTAGQFGPHDGDEGEVLDLRDRAREQDQSVVPARARLLPASYPDSLGLAGPHPPPRTPIVYTCCGHGRRLLVSLTPLVDM
eukprot:6178720-Pyramimonas_sp.AAC.2